VEITLERSKGSALKAKDEIASRKILAFLISFTGVLMSWRRSRLFRERPKERES
jgi:hypothetical protein